MIARVRVRRLAERRARLQVTQRRRMRLQRRQIQSRKRRILADRRRRILLSIGRHRLLLAALRGRLRAGRSAPAQSTRRRGTVLGPRSTQREGQHAQGQDALKFAHRFPYGTTTVSPGFKSDVLFGVIAFDHFLVIERQFLLFAVLGPQQVNRFQIGELREAGLRQRLQHRHVRQQRHRSGVHHFSGHKNAPAGHGRAPPPSLADRQ